jgi:hypothetical protein
MLPVEFVEFYITDRTFDFIDSAAPIIENVVLIDFSDYSTWQVFRKALTVDSKGEVAEGVKIIENISWFDYFIPVNATPISLVVFFESYLNFFVG